MSDQKETLSTSDYGLVIGGYRVKFSNWSGSEMFFAAKEDAETYLAKYEAYGYKGSVETIWFNVKAGA